MSSEVIGGASVKRLPRTSFALVHLMTDAWFVYGKNSSITWSTPACSLATSGDCFCIASAFSPPVSTTVTLLTRRKCSEVSMTQRTSGGFGCTMLKLELDVGTPARHAITSAAQSLGIRLRVAAAGACSTSG